MAYTRLPYDPWDTPPEEREATFVGREILLEQLLSAVGEQHGHGTVQHYLLLGPRGIGKTSVLLTVRDKVRADPVLSTHWFCVQLREEEYFVRTLRDLLDLTLQALSDDENLPEAADLARQVHGERDGERSLAIAVDGLRAISETHQKRILLLIDNFDQVFPQTPTGRRKTQSPENEYRAFRKLLSTESFLMVIGASVRLFEEIAAYDQAFFNFFCPVEIPNLSDDEICELLRKRAEADGNYAFLKKLNNVKDQVRAITYMTGGNPRLVLILYDVLSQREMLPVVQALRETVGSLTPMLKHIMDDMPRQQSKTLDALVRLGGVASPSSIAELARLPLNVVTAQLGRLKDARFVVVEGEGKGRPAAYRVADPMFRTWYQMRYLRPAGRRIELFVEFLRAWFSVEDRRRFIEERWGQLQKCARGSSYSQVADTYLGIEYYAASLEDERERRMNIDRLADTMFESGHPLKAGRLLAEFAAPAADSPAHFDSAGYLALAERRLKKGDPEKAIETCTEALKKDPKSAQARMLLGVSLGLSGDLAGAQAEFDRVASAPNLSKELLAKVLFSRGVCKGKLGDTHGAIVDYTAVVELPGGPADVVAKALVNRGFSKGMLGDTNGAIVDYTAAVELPGAPADQVAPALFNRGSGKEILGDTRGAIVDYTAAVELAGAPTDQVAKALFNRGFAKGMVGDMHGAIVDYTAVVELAGAPTDQVAKALVSRGLSKEILGDTRGAIVDYTAVVELPGAPADEVARALLNRGEWHGKKCDYESALRDSEAALNVTGVSQEGRMFALLGRAIALTNLHRTSDATRDYAECAETGTNTIIVHSAIASLILTNMQQNRHEEAIHWAARVSQLEPDDATLEQRLGIRINIVTSAWRAASLNAAESLLDTFLKNDSPEIRERIAFLKPAIEFARTGDERVFTSLPQEEQKVAKQIAAVLKGGGDASVP